MRGHFISQNLVIFLARRFNLPSSVCNRKPKGICLVPFIVKCKFFSLGYKNWKTNTNTCMMRSLLQKTKTAILLAVFLPLFAAAFSPPNYQISIIQQNQATHRYSAFMPLAAELEENNHLEVNEVDTTGSVSDVEKDNFDGEGFANYLGPYIVTLIASIAVTAGFVKFVLMDY
jgi:hypothetical protein